MATKSEQVKPKSYFRALKNYVTDESNAFLLKTALFFQYGGAACVFPFFVLQMRQLGFSISEIALIYLLVPVSSLLGPVLSGLVADKLGRYNLVVFGNMFLFTVCINTLLFVPPVPKSSIEMSCLNSTQYKVNLTNCASCPPFQQEIQLKVKNCSFSDGTKLEPSINMDYNKNGSLPEGMELEPLMDIDSKKNGSFSNGTDIKPPVDSGSNKVSMTVVKSERGSYYVGQMADEAHEWSVCDKNGTVTCIVEEPSNEYSSTFYVFLTLKLIGNLFGGATFSMMDASILAVCKKFNLNFGRQKVPGTVALAIFPLLSGVLIDVFSKKVGHDTYIPAFVLGSLFTLVASGIMLTLDIKVEPEKENILKNLGKLLTHSEVLAFLLVMLILGINFGFVETYIFIYLKELGAPGSLFGLTLFVGCTASIPMLIYAEHFEKLVGRQNVYLICFTVYAVRMFGYSLIYNPWHALFFELLEAFTYQLMWITSLRMCPIIAPKGLLATMTGCTGAVHYSLGKGIGGFVGGYIIEFIGLRQTWRVFSLCALFGGGLYFILHHLFLKEKLIQREAEIAKEAKEKEECLLTEKPAWTPQIKQSEIYSSVGELSCPSGQIPVVSPLSPSSDGTCLSRTNTHTSMPYLGPSLSLTNQHQSLSSRDLSIR